MLRAYRHALKKLLYALGVCPVSLPLCLVSSAAGKPYLYLTLNFSTSVQGNMMVGDIGYWLLEQIRNYLHCDSMFGI